MRSLASGPYIDSSRIFSVRLVTLCLRVGCGRISGLFVEGVCLLANMDSRAPRASRGTGVERRGCYRRVAVSVGPKGHGSGHSLRISGRRGEGSLCRARHAVGDILGPHCSNHASQFIGDRNRGFVVAAPFPKGHWPVLPASERGAARRPRDRECDPRPDSASRDDGQHSGRLLPAQGQAQVRGGQADDGGNVNDNRPVDAAVAWTRLRAPTATWTGRRRPAHECPPA